MKKFILFLVCLLAFLAPVGASARIIGVPGDSPTIQAGIDASTPGDTVLVQPGRYLETIDFKGKDIVLGSLYITTQDTSYISKTIIDAQQKNTVVTFQTGETAVAELCGFTITNGKSRGSVIHPEYNSGGGICCKGASPYLHHLYVMGNRSLMDGGGMYLERSNSIIKHCVINSNNSERGGGIFFLNGLHILKNILCSDNYSQDGGGCMVLKSEVMMEKCVFFKNVSSYGRAIYNIKSKLNIINSTISDHKGYDAIFILGSKTILINSILWNDCEYEVESRSESWGYSPSNITIIYSDVKNPTTMIHVDKNDTTYFDTVININPLFVNSSQNDYRLFKNSPCRDVGISRYVLNNDVIVDLSKDSYYGMAPDIGAYEYDEIISSVLSYSLSPFTYVTNHPNPFNIYTSINIELNSLCHTNITVYNILGEKISTLFSGYLIKGRHSFLWNGKKESTGVYFFKVVSANFSCVGKMLLIK